MWEFLAFLFSSLFFALLGSLYGVRTARSHAVEAELLVFNGNLYKVSKID